MIRDFYLSGPLSKAPPVYVPDSEVGDGLLGMLTRWNGAYAYCGAFVVLPSGPCPDCPSMEEVNAGGWKSAYPDDARKAWYFGVDAVGNTFGILDGRVVHLNTATGALARLNANWDDFLALVGANPDALVRLDLFEAWVAAGNTLRLRQRLAPAVPFHKGGGRTVAGLSARDLTEVLETNAFLYEDAGPR